MKRLLISALAVASALAFALPASAQDLASQIVGVWKVKAFDTTEVESKKISKGYGDKPAGYYLFSKGGTFMAVVFDSDRKRPATATPTDAERIELSKSIGVTTGTYKVDGSNVTVDLDGSLIQFPVGTKQVRKAEIKGNTMVLTSPAIISPMLGTAIVFTVTLERLE